MKILNWNKAAQFSCEGFKAYFTHAFTVIWLLDRLDHSHFHHSPPSRFTRSILSVNPNLWPLLILPDICGTRRMEEGL